MKDHYQVLGIESRASRDSIKKAFRSLALQYHPDKNKDRSAAARFDEIQEAYQVLIDPVRRAAYDHQRYLSGGRRPGKPIARNLFDVLQASRSLAEKVHQTDPFRTDLDKLQHAVNELLSPHHIHLLSEARDTGANRAFTGHLLKTLELLPLRAVRKAFAQLAPLTMHDNELQQELAVFLRQAKWRDYWNRYKIWMAVAAAVIFCLIIYLAGK